MEVMKKYKISAQYLKKLCLIGQKNTETWGVDTTIE